MHPDCREANNLCHPWSLGSGDPCRNNGILSLAETTKNLEYFWLYTKFANCRRSFESKNDLPFSYHDGANLLMAFFNSGVKANGL